MCSSSLLHDAVKNLATDVVKRELSRDNNNQVIGLGSGSTVAVIVREMAKLPNKKTLEFVAPSLQIKREAEKSGLKLVDENRIPDIDIVFDGADQIDSKFCMIKGGGGALLKEKILISAATEGSYFGRLKQICRSIQPINSDRSSPICQIYSRH